MQEGWTKLKVVVGNPEGGSLRREYVKVLDHNGKMVSGIQAVDVKLHVDRPGELTITTIDFDAVVEGEYKVNRPRQPFYRRVLARFGL